MFTAMTFAPLYSLYLCYSTHASTRHQHAIPNVVCLTCEHRAIQLFTVSPANTYSIESIPGVFPFRLICTWTRTCSARNTPATTQAKEAAAATATAAAAAAAAAAEAQRLFNAAEEHRRKEEELALQEQRLESARAAQRERTRKEEEARIEENRNTAAASAVGAKTSTLEEGEALGLGRSLVNGSTEMKMRDNGDLVLSSYGAPVSRRIAQR